MKTKRRKPQPEGPKMPKGTTLPQATVVYALRTWALLQPVLRQCNEQQSTQLLRAEQAGKHRHWMLDRIFGHYDKLRCERERWELFQFIAKAKLGELKGTKQWRNHNHNHC